MAKKKKLAKEARPTAKTTPTDVTVKTWTREDQLWLAALVLISTLVYWYTMWPALGGGDSGELTAVAHTLGIVHPPGYPLFTMLAHLFTYLPFGTVAYRVNLFSLVCMVSALSLAFLTIRRLTDRSWLSFAVLGLTAFSPLIWRYAIVAEVFALNNLFVAALMYGLVRAIQSNNHRHAYWMAFVFGLGLSNHHTLLFVGVPAGIYLLAHFRSQLLTIKSFLALFVLSVAGLTPYAYLFWASARIPLVAWGDITSWAGFKTHFFREEYGTFKLATEGSDRFQLFHGLLYYFQNVAQVFGYIGAVFVGCGLYAIFKRKTERPFVGGFLWLVWPFLYLIFFHTLANLPFVDGAALYRDIVSRFWLMPNLQMAAIAAVGYVWAEKYFSASQRKAAFYIAVIAPFVAIAVHFEKENHRDNYTFTNFGRYLLQNLPANAVFFSLGDINTNTIRYLQNSEGFRKDVKVLDRSLMSYPWFKRIANHHYPDVILPGAAYHPTQRGAYDFKKLFDANFDRHKIYMTMVKLKDSNEAFDKAWEKDYQLTPYGLTYLVSKKSNPQDIDSYISESAQFLRDPLAEFPRKPLADSWDAVIQANYWLARHLRAAEILRFALKSNSKPHFEIAEKLLEELVAKNPAPPADYYKNLGIAHQHLSKFAEGDSRRKHEIRMLEVWELYINKTDRRDKTFDDIKTVLRHYGKIK